MCSIQSKLPTSFLIQALKLACAFMMLPAASAVRALCGQQPKAGRGRPVDEQHVQMVAPPIDSRQRRTTGPLPEVARLPTHAWRPGLRDCPATTPSSRLAATGSAQLNPLLPAAGAADAANAGACVAVLQAA